MASSETSTTPLEPMAGGRVEGEGWLGEKWLLGALMSGGGEPTTVGGEVLTLDRFHPALRRVPPRVRESHGLTEQTDTATHTTQDNDAGTSTHTAHTQHKHAHTRGTDTSKPNDTDAQQTDTATI